MIGAAYGSGAAAAAAAGSLAASSASIAAPGAERSVASVAGMLSQSLGNAAASSAAAGGMIHGDSESALASLKAQLEALNAAQQLAVRQRLGGGAEGGGAQQQQQLELQLGQTEQLLELLCAAQQAAREEQVRFGKRFGLGGWVMPRVALAVGR